MQADIVIVGAGIMGIVAAYQVLQRQPDCNIIHIEQSLIGSGATRYSAAFAPLVGANATVLQWAKDSRQMYHQMRQDIANLPLFEQASYWISSNDNLAQMRHQLSADETTLAQQSDWHSDTLKAGGFNDQQNHSMLFHDVGSYSLPAEFLNTVLQQLEQRPNYSLRQCVKLEDISQQSGRYLITTSDGGEIQANRVLLTIGPWFKGAPWLSAFDDIDIRLKKVLAFHIHQKPPIDAKAMFFPDHEAFLLPIKAHGHWIFSYTCDEWDCLPDANALHINQDNVTKSRRILTAIAPNFVEHCAGGSEFCDSYSHDHMPIVKKAHLGDNMVAITATNGAGFRLAPALVKQALASFSLTI